MKKEMFENLINGRGCATSSLFSAEDKELIYSIMEKNGMCRSTAYNRFFRDGFKEWELLGATKAIYQFVHMKQMDTSVLDNVKTFFLSLENKSEFKSFMNNLGMGINSVVSHFTDWSFKKWEEVGVRQIIERYFYDEDEIID
ncbi:hypothetical protein [Bacteroides sp.]|uniref:hypothetical protein n=1 Tax=Bacteroides sp. TaxID=29523 RepID=UPI00261A87CC|nr:hypothetical protein [Bacteroides sp.]MDD3037952.1 hypothetical protein [Bacteroides sp.]